MKETSTSINKPEGSNWGPIGVAAWAPKEFQMAFSGGKLQNAFFISFCTHGMRYFEIIFTLNDIPVICTRTRRLEMAV